ncbi:MAG: tetratricopeptide repeat protein [Verrucomicrobiota bacterium]
MTNQPTESVPGGIDRANVVARFLPWMVAAGTFLIYLLTLNHWVTLRSLRVVAKVVDWDWRPETTAPIHFLVTYPLHWLSGNAQLVALNFFSAICAALTLALLCRSVQLLPHDRTSDQRRRELGKFAFLNVSQAWLAPVGAALVCGLELTFWEHAVSATGEMFDLLLFAYVIRCLLEFRASKNENWLTKFAVVYGLAVTNNWAMLGFFPFFLTAMIWIKGLRFFEFRFVSRMVLFGTIGLLFYLFLPIVVGFSGHSDLTFFQALRENLGFQKSYLYNFPFVQFPAIRSHLLMIGLSSILPLLLIAIRWPTFRGEVNPAGTAVTTFMFRMMHLVFLGISLWIFFDPGFSARLLGYELLPYLTFYYLTALGVGYFIGYILLIFGQKPVQAWERSRSSLKFIDPIVVAVAWSAILAVPIALARKNLPLIQATNSNVANEFFKTTSESLPARGAVVLSDDSTRLFLLQAIDAQLGRKSQNILVDTAALKTSAYHRYLHARHSSDWPEQGATNPISDYGLILRMDELHKNHPLYYLHPSFGYYFERFYPTPHKLVYELNVYATNSIVAPPLPGAVISENQGFWNSFTKESLPSVLALGKKSPDVQLINNYYSRAVNHWGTELQKAKMLPEAGASFATSFSLNPENVVAQINQQFNSSLQKGEIRPVESNDELEKKLGQYRDLKNAVTGNGPFDEPNFCLRLGELLGLGGNLRQSAQLFLRVLELVPTDFFARLGLSKTYIELQRPDEALRLVKQLQNDAKTLASNPNLEFELLRVESLAYLAKNDLPTAEKILLTASARHPRDENQFGLLTQFYLDVGQYTNALQTVEKQLAVAPKNARAVFTKGVLQMQMSQFSQAVSTFDELLKMTPDNQSALFNRAIANLQSGQLENAKRDYQDLRKSHPANTYQIYYGLAQIAEKQHDKSAALKNYKLYSKYAPAGTPEFEDVQKRMKALETGKG